MTTPFTRAMLLLTSLVPLLATACDAGEPQGEQGEQVRTLFEGDEVQAELAANPDAVFFVDLTAGHTIAFDQRNVPLDYANFIVQCPTMLAPIPLDAFLQLFPAIDPSAPAWTLRSTAVDAPDDQFRQSWGTFDAPQPDLQCTESCSGGSDCVWICG